MAWNGRYSLCIYIYIYSIYVKKIEERLSRDALFGPRKRDFSKDFFCSKDAWNRILKGIRNYRILRFVRLALKKEKEKYDSLLILIP